MLAMTTAVPVPNLTRLRVRRVELDQDASEAYVHVEVGGAGGRVYGQFRLVVRNGFCESLRRTPAPTGWADLYGYGDPVNLVTGFTDFVSAYVGGTIAARNRAAETWLSDPSRALIEEGTVS